MLILKVTVICIVMIGFLEWLFKEKPTLCNTCINRQCTSNHSPCIHCNDGSNYESDDEVKI